MVEDWADTVEFCDNVGIGLTIDGLFCEISMFGGSTVLSCNGFLAAYRLVEALFEVIGELLELRFGTSIFVAFLTTFWFGGPLFGVGAKLRVVFEPSPLAELDPMFCPTGTLFEVVGVLRGLRRIILGNFTRYLSTTYLFDQTRTKQQQNLSQNNNYKLIIINSPKFCGLFKLGANVMRV